MLTCNLFLFKVDLTDSFSFYHWLVPCNLCCNWINVFLKLQTVPPSKSISLRILDFLRVIQEDLLILKEKGTKRDLEIAHKWRKKPTNMLVNVCKVKLWPQAMDRYFICFRRKPEFFKIRATYSTPLHCFFLLFLFPFFARETRQCFHFLHLSEDPYKHT